MHGHFKKKVIDPTEVVVTMHMYKCDIIDLFFFRQLRFNEVLNWSSDHSVVTFMPNRTYIFDPETSCDGCDDKNDSFFTVNIPLLVRSQCNSLFPIFMLLSLSCISSH